MQAYWIVEAKPQVFFSYVLDRVSAQLHVQTITSKEGAENTHLVKGYVSPRGQSGSSEEENIFLCCHQLNPWFSNLCLSHYTYWTVI